MLKALGSFSAVFGEEWKEKTDRDFVKVILKILNYFELDMAGIKSFKKKKNEDILAWVS